MIPPIYRKLADELLVELHLLSHQKDFKINCLFAVGLSEVFNTFTQGYKPVEHLSQLFEALCTCSGFNPKEINALAEQTIKDTSNIDQNSVKDYLINKTRTSSKDPYYTRMLGIGLYKIIENSDIKIENESNISEYLKDLSSIIGLDFNRLDKDLSLYKSNIDKMKQALEILALATKKNDN